MNWSTCWISRRTLHLVPMISSTLQRLSTRTCGLFDTGFAGDVDDIASTGLNASADALSDFRSDDTGHSFSLFDGKGEEVKVAADDSWMDDFDGLSGDPLGDDSMEAFINLDTFLNGNSFFDEDDNLVPDNKEEGGDQQREAVVLPVIDLSPQHMDMAPLPVEVPDINFLFHQQQQGVDEHGGRPTTKTKPAGRSSRKRKAGSAAATAVVAAEGVRTSLYEIPATGVLPDILDGAVEIGIEGSRDDDGGGVVVLLSDADLDHDYSSKRQRLAVPGDVAVEFVAQDGVGEISSLLCGGGTSAQALIEMDGNGGGKVDKQTMRRIKNNHASKRSREQRKQKVQDMDVEAEELVVRNQELREKIVELEQLAKEMKAALVAKMSGKAV